ncbi:MAG: tripartite tricarboxylate transporter permease [Candidatus Pacearchaeota archaeon]|jgi:putative membrane protein
MLIEILLAFIAGTLMGVFTGLIPGIHINLVAFFLLTISAILLPFFPPISLVIFIVSLSITHIFIDFIPTIFLGAPNEDTSLSILPGHEMLIAGQGYEAVMLSVFGALIGVILLIPLIPLFIIFLPAIYPYIQRIIPLILIMIILIMILFEKNKILTLFIVLLSGFLGYSSLNLNLKDPLLPLLTGLFGSSSLVTSITQKTTISKQEIISIKNILGKNKISSFIKCIFASLIASPLCSFLPALGSSQASAVGSYVIGKLNKKEFLILVGIVSTLVMSLSFVTLYLINKSRTGSAVAVSKLIPLLSQSDLALITLIIIISAVFSFVISILIAKYFSKIITKISYSKLSLFILTFLTLIVIIFSGIIGLIIYVTSTALGILCILLGVKRTSLMGCLLIPTILIYLF